MAISLTSTSSSGTLTVNSVDVLTADASGNVSLRTAGALQPLATLPVIKQSVSVTTNGAAAYDFTGIPAAVKRVVVKLNGVSGNGGSNFLLQLGTSSGIENSGYLGAVNRETNILGFTTGFQLMFNITAAISNFTTVYLELVNGNNWLCTFVSARSDDNVSYGAGSKSLSGVLDRIRLTTVNGTDLFDAGTLNISWEF